MIRISFIIPAYNAERCIRRCLDSVYKLPIAEDESEVIVVDDCSTDQTADFVEEYALSHPNLTLLCQSENHRQGAARNRALSASKGKHIVFLDSDDEIADGIIEALSTSEKNNLDLCCFNYVFTTNGETAETKARDLSCFQSKQFTGIELQTYCPFWCTAPWGYLYNRSFIDSVQYPFAEDVLYEDSDFVSVHLFHARRMMYVSECGYRAFYNPCSTTRTISYKHIADYFLLGTRMLDFYQTIEPKGTLYSESILEGGNYNIWKAFKKITKLSNIKEVKSCFDRIDKSTKRSRYCQYTKPSIYWNMWTRLCMRNRRIIIILLSLAIPVFNLSGSLYQTVKETR